MPETRGTDRAKFAAAVRRQRGDREEHAAWAAGLVQPFIITLALDAAGLYGPQVDEACGTFEPAVDMWEAGQLYPTWPELNALAELTRNTVNWFVMRHEPIPFEATTLRFHLKPGEEPLPPPVLCFEPEAILAATGTGRCPYCGLSAVPVRPVSLAERRFASAVGRKPR